MLISGSNAVELLFKIQTQGAPDIDKVAASLRTTSSSALLASDSLANLDKTLLAMTAALDANTAALAGNAKGFDGMAVGATKAAGGTRVLTNELRMLEGAMPIRAAASFLTQMSGLNAVMGMAFPIFGAIALVGVLDTILERTGLMPKAWDEVAEAQKSSLDLMKKSTQEYDQHLEKLKKIKLDMFELANGKDARRAMEAFDLQFKAGSTDRQSVETLEKQVAAIRYFSGSHFYTGKDTPDANTRFFAQMAGLRSAADDNLAQAKLPLGLNGESFGSRQEAAKDLLPGLEAALRAARTEKEVDEASAGLEQARIAADQKEKAADEAKKRQQEIEQSEKQAADYKRRSLEGELGLLGKINLEYEHQLELVKSQAALDDVNAGHAAQLRHALDTIQKDNQKYLAGVVEANDKSDAQSDKFGAKAYLAGLKKDIDQGTKELAAIERVIQRSDEGDASGVERALGVTVRGNALAARSGQMSGEASVSSTYQARIAAADKILAIETKRLDVKKLDAALTDLIAGKQMDLSDQELKDLDRLADLRKKRADEVYRAEADYENQLQELRERDLQKYQQMAGSLFDAIHGHSMSQWLHDFALGQAKHVFTNAATKPLQQVGHALGGITGGWNPGGILTGTVLDPANGGKKGDDEHLTLAKGTEKHTSDTVAELKALRTALTGQGGDPTSASAIPDIFNLPTTGGTDRFNSILFGNGGLLGTGTVPNVGAGPGIGTSLFQAGNGSGFGQFFSGLTGMGSNPLGAIFGGMSTNGSTVTQLTGLQRAGAAVGTATALAGAGMGIYSGIEQGGVSGYSKAAASGLGAAAMLDPEPISKTILSIGAGIAGMVSSIFGDSKQKRSTELTRDIAKNQYLAPTAMNVIQGMNGTYEDFDARGNIRTSSMSAVPTVAEPYITSRRIDGQLNYYNVPGQVTTPYSGGPTGNGQAPVSNTTNINIQAMDSESFDHFLQNPRNAATLGDHMANLVPSHARLGSELRFVTGTE